MALQVWLPLNGDLHNQGLMPITFSTVTANWDAAGKIGQAFSTLNSNVIWTCPNLNGVTTFSLTFWCCPKTNSSITTNWCNIIALGSKSADNSTSAEFRFESSYSNTYILSHHNNAGEPIGGGTASLVSERDKWYHIAVIVNNEAHTIRYYVNGIQLTASGFLKTHNGGHLDGTIKLANENIDPDCLLNDIRIYDHALNDKEVKEISKGLILHYQLNNNGMGNPNILTGTYYNSYGSGLAAASTARNIDGKWAAGSGGNGKFSVTEDLSCPIGKYSWNVLNNTSGNRDFQQGDQPYVSGQIYTTSFWAKGSGTCLYRSWNSTDGKQMFSKTWTLTENWTYYTYTFTASAEMETDSCTFHLGVTGASSISICGMKMEKGNKATPYCTAIGELIPENIIYDSSGYNNNGSILNSLMINTDSIKYNVTSNFNGSDSGILIENLELSNILNNQTTISFWINPQGENGARSIYFGSYSSTSWSIEKTTSNILRSYWDGSPDTTCTGATITDGVWQHICIVKNGTADLKVYINGILKFSSTATLSAKTFPTTYRIGRDTRSGDGTPYHGNMSDFRIYTTALSAADVLDLYKTSKIINGTNKVPRDLE